MEKKKYKNTIIHIIQILLIIVFMISLTPKEFQNDTFFTIIIGDRILENGIETEEKLVWHENLEFTNSRWLFDTIVAIINNHFGYLGIYIFVMICASTLGILFYIIINNITKNKGISFISTIMIMYFSKHVITARAQVVSFPLFLLEFYAIEKLLETNKKRYFAILAIIPLILVNVHASVFPMYFVLYLPYIAESILAKLKLNKSEKLIIEERSIKLLTILCIIGFLLGFVTPESVSPYTDMFKVMDGISTEFISELKAIDINMEITFWGLLILTIALMIFSKTKIKVSDSFFILGFALMSLSTYRTVFFFYFISSICIIRFVNDFIKENNIDVEKINEKIKIVALIVMYVCILFNSINTLFVKLKADYINTVDYPYNASEFIINSVDMENMRIFNHFNFGSYLELKGIKAFIDSRSGIFTDEFNPGTTILEDWITATSGETHYKEIFDKYDITHALLYNEELICIYIRENPDWKLIYQDDRFSLYEKITK